MLAHYADDAVQEFPYGTPPGVRVEGREAIRARMTAALAVFRMELRITDAHPLADPDVMVVEFESRGHLEPSKVPYENTYVSIFGFRDDRVAWVREYYDPIVSAKALARDAKARES